jgi:hypothetical protein
VPAAGFGLSRFDGASVRDFHYLTMKKNDTKSPSKPKMKPHGVETAEEIRRLIVATYEAANKVASEFDWIVHMKFGVGSRSQTIAGLAYINGKIHEVTVHVRDGDPSPRGMERELPPVSLADAMQVWLDMETTSRFSWSETYPGESHSRFMRSVQAALAAAEAGPAAIAA